MALGGGTFVTQNKVLPGTYINFVSASRASATLSERGVATMPLTLDWGAEDSVFTVTAEQFQKDSLKIFGYPYTHDKLKCLRELFLHIRTGHFYRLDSGGTAASNELATALYPGERGNGLKITVEAGEDSTEDAPVYDVSTYLDSTRVDTQTVATAAELKANDYVRFNAQTLALTAGMPLAGGGNGSVEAASYQFYLDKIEACSFNTIGCASTDETVKRLFCAFTKRMRDDVGVKFQCVLFRPDEDYEGVIGVENGLAQDGEDASLVYWATGAEAGCEVNASLVNASYDGEFDVDTNYTQTQLSDGIQAGKLMLHRVDGEVRVLDDINTFTSFRDGKGGDFSSNQTMRVLDQIANDIAVLFNTRYLGMIPNDAAGRVSLWSDIVKHHEQLQAIRAIENFRSEDVAVTQGDSKRSVVVSDIVTVVNAMAQLYMTVTVA